MKSLLSALLLFSFLIIMNCQEYKSSFILGMAPHYGFIIKHSGKLGDLTKSYPFGFEITAGWQMMDSKSWQYCFCYPRVGLSFFYLNYANPRKLGSSFNLFPFVEPSINGENRIHAFIRFGIGPSYLNVVFDSIDNPENKFFSSHISFIVHLSAGIHYSINPRANLRLVGAFNHISNGGIKNPNLGINFPTASLAFEYNLSPLPFIDYKKDRTIRLVAYKNRIDLVAFATGKTAVKGQERYPVLGSIISLSHVVGRQHALSVGGEFTFDYADKKEIEKSNPDGNSLEVDFKYLAILGGHEFILGRFNFYQQLGIYAYSPYERKNLLYQRYGLSFYLTDNIFIGINLKAHAETADFLDFRAGISLSN